MPRVILYPHSLQSDGCDNLRDELNRLGVKCIKVKPEGSSYHYQTGDWCVSWGNSARPPWDNSSVKWINHPDRVAVCANKLKTFQCLNNHAPIVEWTTSMETAGQWIDQGNIVMCRQKLTGSGGEGIVIAKTKDELVSCPVLSKYFPRKHEYRIHCLSKNGNVTIIDFTQKKKSSDFSGEVNKLIRTFEHGYIYARDGVVLPRVVKDAAIKAVKQLGMDLCSVDVGLDFEANISKIFEGNSASGIEATTVQRYAASIKAYIEDRPIPAAPGSEIDAPLWDGKKKSNTKTNILGQSVAPSIVAAKAESRQEATLVKPAPTIQNVSVARSSKAIKIKSAEDIEINEENGRLYIYAKLPHSLYPVRIARIDGTNLVLKEIES